LKELFSQIGAVTSAKVNRDTQGQSTGVGIVTFARKNDAARAFQKYNQVTLDSRPMMISIQGGAKPGAAVRSAKTAGARPRGGRGGHAKKTPANADQLDKELDSYLAGGQAE
jgi:RNA recognition motif-containing protein